ncbi:hypothetical protein [Mesoterricola sediminis]|uniref:Uncharacterized protein n=1 Tax=Mesoterricola sediminis TaxID=2927980 RepID=A0AA48HDV8_9BACT|nr:hypothetical protein [Mesoterricola sediminis]BDU76458.1 hypothetical protein METESE_14160 [Mesoterricola sediminis]
MNAPDPTLAGALRRHAARLTGLLVVLALLALPLVLAATGYHPTDDALRHAAQAVDGRPWTEILVLRPGILVDQHQAWHALLRACHAGFGLDAHGLVVLSVVGLAALVLLAPLPWMRVPEAWVCAWVLLWIAGGGQMRLMLGRPLLVAMAGLLVLLSLWTRETRPGPWARWLGTPLVFGVAALLHGSWYLLALIPLAFLAANRRWEAGRLALAWMAGCAAAALATGHPVTFLAGELIHLGHALGPLGQGGLVAAELGPSLGSGLVGCLLLVTLLWAVERGEEGARLGDPIFLLALGGWLLGLKVSRFWLDWGLPATALWLARQLEPALAALGERAPGRRLVLALGAGLAAILLVTSADPRRWAERTHANSIAADRPELQGWLPGDGGVIYAANMAVFYDTYYRNPHARWRYVLGFEPTLMPDADLAVYRRAVAAYDDPTVWRPWIARMGPADRLAYVCAYNPRFLFPDLQWAPVGRAVWLGRKPVPVAP